MDKSAIRALVQELGGSTKHTEKTYNLYPAEEQMERLKDYIVFRAEQEERIKDIIPGTFVTRNALGKTKYAMPWNGQKAIVVRRFPRQEVNEDGLSPNAEMAVVIDSKKVMTFPVDLNYYEKE